VSALFAKICYGELMKKLSLYIFLVLMWCNVGFAECIKGDCNNGYGTYTYANGSKYVGEWKDGKENGQGTYTWVSGNTWLNGNKYVGEYKNGKIYGQGTYTWANGNKYVGEFKDAKRNGLGTYTFANGTVDKGIWKNNQLIEPKQ